MIDITVVSIVVIIIAGVAIIIITIIDEVIVTVAVVVAVVVAVAVAVATITVVTSIVIVVITGQTVEMHGNINQLVCPSCGVVVMMTPALLRKLRSKKPVPCTKCDCEAIRCRIMLYDDAEGTYLCDSPLMFFYVFALFLFFFFLVMCCCRTSIIVELQSWQHDMWFWRCVLNTFGGISALNSCQTLPKIKLR